MVYRSLSALHHRGRHRPGQCFFFFSFFSCLGASDAYRGRDEVSRQRNFKFAMHRIDHYTADSRLLGDFTAVFAAKRGAPRTFTIRERSPLSKGEPDAIAHHLARIYIFSYLHPFYFCTFPFFRPLTQILILVIIF